MLASYEWKMSISSAVEDVNYLNKELMTSLIWLSSNKMYVRGFSINNWSYLYYVFFYHVFVIVIMDKSLAVDYCHLVYDHVVLLLRKAMSKRYAHQVALRWWCASCFLQYYYPRDVCSKLSCVEFITLALHPNFNVTDNYCCFNSLWIAASFTTLRWMEFRMSMYIIYGSP